MFESALVNIIDALIESGLSEWEATNLVGNLLESLMTPEEIEERIAHTEQNHLLS